MSAHRLTSHVLYSDLFTEFSSTPQAEHDTIEIALLHLLKARWQLFEIVNQAQNATEYAAPHHAATDAHVPAPCQHKQANLRGNVMVSWRSSNNYLEHALAKLAEQPLEHRAINLNTLIGSIIDTLDSTLDSDTHVPDTDTLGTNALDTNALDTNLFGVDIGLATKLPVVTAPLPLLYWVFSELLITSWFNSLPATPTTLHTSSQVSLTEMATVAISCLDADDAWHITISSDHHYPSLVTASLTQLKGALQQFGGDVCIASEDGALLQTVILPKYSCVSH